MAPPCRPSLGRSLLCTCRRSRTANAEESLWGVWIRDPVCRRRGLRGRLPGARAGRLDPNRGRVRVVRGVRGHRHGALHLCDVDDVRIGGNGGLGARELAPPVEEGDRAADEQEHDEDGEHDGGDRARRQLVLADGARVGVYAYPVGARGGRRKQEHRDRRQEFTRVHYERVVQDKLMNQTGDWRECRGWRKDRTAVERGQASKRWGRVTAREIDQSLHPAS